MRVVVPRHGCEKTMADPENTVEKPPAVVEAGDPSGPADASGATSEDRASFLGRLKSAWRETVGNYATDDSQTKNLMGRLVEFGTLTRDEAKKLVGETKERIEQNRRELDRRVDESIKAATARLTLPSDDDIAGLNQKLDAIEQRIAALEQKRA